MCIYLRAAFISLKHGFSAVFIHEQRLFEEVRYFLPPHNIMTDGYIIKTKMNVSYGAGTAGSAPPTHEPRKPVTLRVIAGK